MQVSKDCGFALHGWSRTRYFLISGSKDCGFDSLYGWSRTHNFLKVQKIAGSTSFTGGVEPTIFFYLRFKRLRVRLPLRVESNPQFFFYLRFKRLRVRLPSRVESNPQSFLSKLQKIAGSTPFKGGVEPTIFLRFKRLQVRLPSRVESNLQSFLSKLQKIIGSTPFTGGVEPTIFFI